MFRFISVALVACAALTFAPGGDLIQVGHHRVCLVLPQPGRFTPALVLQGKDCRPGHHHQEAREDGQL